MSQKKHETKTEAREGKREQFASAPEKRSGLTTPILIIIGLVLAGLVGYVVLSNRNEPALVTEASANRQAQASTGSAGGAVSADANGEISIPLSELSPRARFYEYRAGTTTVRFFAIKSSDGVYRAALDACDVCFAAKKGYAQSGDDMVCQKCGNHFPSSEINEVEGGCNPVGLERKVENDRLIIKAKDLEARTSYF
jgi:hypothetical protein